MPEVETGDDAELAEPSVRWSAVQIALNVVGLNAGQSPNHYGELVSNLNDSEQMRRDMLGMSGCALVVRGLWGRLGVVHPILSAPYRIGHAISDLIVIANERGAWRDTGDGSRPKPGDAVLVSKDKPDVHVYTVTGVRLREDGDIDLCSVDGGQRDAQRAETIKAFNRRWHLESNPKGWWDQATEERSPNDTQPYGVLHPVRAVAGWIDIEAILAGQ